MEKARWGLVGRDEDLRRLALAFAADRPILVSGEAGIGKTTLVRAAVVTAGLDLHEGGGFATLATTRFLALERAIGRPIEGDPASATVAVESVVGPDALFIDDLQWVDAGSLETVELLAGRVVLVLAARSDDEGWDAVAAMADRIGAGRLVVGPVGDTAAAEIVRRRDPGLDDASIEEAVAVAGGNPLMLEELAIHRAPTPVLARTIETRLDRLSPSGREAVELLAVAGHPVPRRRIGPTVDEAVEAGLVVERQRLVDIRHELLADAIRSGLDAPTLAARHERVAAIVDDPVETAGHLLAAGLADRAAAVARAGLDASPGAIRRAALLAVLADIAGPGGDPDIRLEAARAASDVSDWESVVRLVGSHGPGADPAVAVERATLLAHARFALGDLAEARAGLEAAREIDVDPSSPAAAHLAIESAAYMVNVEGRIPDAIAHLDGQLAYHPPTDPSHHAIRAIRESVAMLGVMEADIGYIRATVDAALAGGAFADAADLARVVSYALLIWEGPDAALTFLAGMSERFEAAGVAGVALGFVAEAVQASVLAGRPIDAVVAADEVLERPAPTMARHTATIFRARALASMGRLDEASADLDRIEDSVAADFVGRGLWLATMAEIAYWGGRNERAIELVGQVEAIPAPIVNAYVLPWITRAWARLDLGIDPGEIPAVAPTPINAGATPELEGIRCLHRGDAVAAAERFAEAARRNHGFNEPRALVCRWAEGEAWRLAGRRVEMSDRLTAVLADATAAEFEAVALRARRSMRQAGLRPASAHPSTQTARRLTSRERDLIELVGHGLTNVEIARRMGLGRPTVARTLSNAMTKLGADSRGQAVVLAAEPDPI